MENSVYEIIRSWSFRKYTNYGRRKWEGVDAESAVSHPTLCREREGWGTRLLYIVSFTIGDCSGIEPSFADSGFVIGAVSIAVEKFNLNLNSLIDCQEMIELLPLHWD